MRAGIIGYPVDHSASPELFNRYFRVAEIKGLYERVPVADENALKAILENAAEDPASLGFNVTTPWKESVISHLDYLEEPARQIGAVNCIYKNAGNWVGANFDHLGFREPLKPVEDKIESALVLGSGGAAKAVLFALGQMAVKDIWLWARNSAKVADMSPRFGAEPWRGNIPDLTINCTTIGLPGNDGTFPEEISEAIGRSSIAYDLIYGHKETEFLSHSVNRRIDGWPMLVYQASYAARKWFGREFPEKLINEFLNQ